MCFKTACELARLMSRRELGVAEVMAAHLEQIARVNPEVNAICTLVADEAMDEANRADRALAQGAQRGR